MGYRNIFISSPAKLSCKNKQFILNTDMEYSIPIEDINCVMIEDLRCNITAYTLSLLAQEGVTVFICDDKHLPVGTMLSLWNHSRQYKIIKSQLNQKKPFLKRLWQSIIIKKIENQAVCLSLSAKEGEQKLFAIAQNVKSGDVDNSEGKAARYYFQKLFGKGFYRGDDCITNACLNYGYAILRGVVARNLATYGFENSIGIFHHSEQNSFNLADDIIEPFRPVVDLYVKININDDLEELTPKIKQGIFNLLNCNVLSDGQVHTVVFGNRKLQLLAIKNTIASTNLDHFINEFVMR
jgi:CRISPR-associated protein Cas1